MLKRASMLFMGAVKSRPAQPSDTPHADPSSASPDQDQGSSDYGFDATVCCVSGWPVDVSSVAYHKGQGLLVVGTESGALHCYGRNCQFVLGSGSSDVEEGEQSDPSEVCNIFPLEKDKILVRYGDDSLSVYSLPSLDRVCRMPGSWMGKHPPPSAASRRREITCMHVDEASGRSYAYFGSSDGMLFIVEFVCGSFRLCQYSVSWGEAGLPSRMELRDIQMCPKDERFIALGYASVGSSSRVVIYDLSKLKAHRFYAIDNAVTSLQWDHLGSTLYAATAAGSLLALGLDRTVSSLLWSSDSERSSYSSDDTAVLAIRKLYWLATQPSMALSSSTSGVLFLLLGSETGSNADNLRSVVVGLALLSAGGMEEVFALPSLLDEDVVGIRLVPSGAMSALQGSDTDEPATGMLPALLLLTQLSHASASTGEDEEGDGEGEHEGENDGANEQQTKRARQVRIIQCPPGPTSAWGLEIGTLPDPRLMVELLPNFLTSSSLDTVERCHSVVVGNSLLGVVLARLKPSLEEVVEPSWVVPLAHSDGKGPGGAIQAEDVVLLGVEDKVLIWSQTPFSRSSGSVSVASEWNLCCSLPLSGGMVTIIALDSERGVIAAVTKSAWFAIWGLEDSRSDKTILDVQTVKMISAVAKRELHHHAAHDGEESDDDPDEEEDEDEDDTERFSPDGLKMLLNANLGVDSEPTALLLVSCSSSLFVGTSSGAVLCVGDWHAATSTEQVYPPPNGSDKKFLCTGSVVGLTYSSFWLHGMLCPALYVTFSSGASCVVHLHTKQVLAVSTTAAAPSVHDHLHSFAEGEDGVVPRKREVVLFSAVCDEMFQPMPYPDPLDAYFLKQAHFQALSRASPNFGKVLAATSAVAATTTPESAPRFLVVAYRRSILTFDLSKFSVVTKASLASSKRDSLLTYGQSGGSSPVAPVLQAAFVSHRKMVAAELISIQGGDDGGGEISYSICCINEIGSIFAVALAANFRALCAPTRIPAGFLPEPIGRLTGASVMPSGKMYALYGEMLLSAFLRNRPGVSHHMQFDVPAHCAQNLQVLMAISPPPQSCQLLHGREENIAQAQEQARKRSSSILSVLPSSSGAVDLDKLFAKTRALVEKEDLLRGAAGSRSRAPTSCSSPTINEEGDDDDSDSGNGRETPLMVRTKSASTAMSAASDAKVALLARGDKLKRLDQQSDVLRNGAADYATMMADHRKKLANKAARWGLF